MARLSVCACAIVNLLGFFRSSRCSHVAQDSDLLHTVCTVFSGTTCTHQPPGVVPWQERLVRGQEHHADSRAHGMSASVHSKQVRTRMKALSVSHCPEMSQSQWAASSQLRFHHVIRATRGQNNTECSQTIGMSKLSSGAGPRTCSEGLTAALLGWWLSNSSSFSFQDNFGQLAVLLEWIVSFALVWPIWLRSWICTCFCSWAVFRYHTSLFGAAHSHSQRLGKQGHLTFDPIVLLLHVTTRGQ